MINRLYVVLGTKTKKKENLYWVKTIQVMFVVVREIAPLWGIFSASWFEV